MLASPGCWTPPGRSRKQGIWPLRAWAGSVSPQAAAAPDSGERPRSPPRIPVAVKCGGLLHLILRRGGIKGPSRAGISLFGLGYRGRRGKRHPGHHGHIGADHVEPPQCTCSRRPRDRPDRNIARQAVGRHAGTVRPTRERYAAHARKLTRLWPGHPASVQGVAPLPLPRGPLRLALRDRPAKGRFPNYPVRLPGAASVRKAIPCRVFPGFPRSAVSLARVRLRPPGGREGPGAGSAGSHRAFRVRRRVCSRPLR